MSNKDEETEVNEVLDKKAINALVKHSDKLTSVMDEYGKKLYALSKIVVGNGEVKESIIWNLEKVKNEIVQVSKNLDELLEKIDKNYEIISKKFEHFETKFALIDSDVKDIKKNIEKQEKNNDSFKERYVAPVVVSLIIGAIVFVSSHFVNNSHDKENKERDGQQMNILLKMADAINKKEDKHSDSTLPDKN